MKPKYSTHHDSRSNIDSFYVEVELYEYEVLWYTTYKGKFVVFSKTLGSLDILVPNLELIDFINQI